MGSEGRQHRSSETVCDVQVSLSGIDRETRDRLDDALHAVDRKLGVIVGHRKGVPEFTLLTSDSTEEAARERAVSLLEQAASSAEIDRTQLDRFEITHVVTRVRDLTGLPRIVEPPVGRWETIDLDERGELCALHEGPLGTGSSTSSPPSAARGQDAIFSRY